MLAGANDNLLTLYLEILLRINGDLDSCIKTFLVAVCYLAEAYNNFIE